MLVSHPSPTHPVTNLGPAFATTVEMLFAAFASSFWDDLNHVTPFSSSTLTVVTPTGPKRADL